MRAITLGAFAAALIAAAAPAPAGVVLPTSAAFGSVEALGGQLLVSGYDNSSTGCVWLVVNRTSLRTTSLLRASCERPPLAAEPVVPVQFPRTKVAGFEAQLRIARPNRVASRISYGPVVMTFNDVSDTHLEWTYGPRSLWVYDVAALGRDGEAPHAEVVEVSTATGRVVRRVSMPLLYEPLLAADADGLWLAASVETGVGTGVTYHLAVGASAPTLIHRGGYAAYWLVARGHSVWEDVASMTAVAGRVAQEIWRFEGPSGAGHALASANNLRPTSGPPAVAPDSSALWTSDDVLATPGSYGRCSGAQVVRIDAHSGRQRVVRTLKLPGDQCPFASILPFGAGAQAFVAGSFYTLIAGPGQATTLYRVPA